MEFSQANLPLYPILHALGATDEDLKKAWGPELWAANQKKNDPGAVEKLFQRLVRLKPGEVVHGHGVTQLKLLASLPGYSLFKKPTERFTTVA